MPKWLHKFDKTVLGGLAARNPSGATWCDRTNITSSALNLTAISAPVVTNSSRIMLGTYMSLASSETVPFNSFVVKSINPGTGFVVGPVNSVAALVTSYQLSWLVVN